MFSSLISSMPQKAKYWAATTSTACVLCAAGNAQAAQLYATDVVYYDNNGTSMASYRTDINNALGDPGLTADSSNGYRGNKDFLSLGVGGRAVFNFGQDFSGDVSIWETTWGNKSKQSQYDERIDIYYGNFESGTDWSALANDLDQWTSAGEILNIEDNAYNTASGATNAGFSPEGIFNHILLVDKSKAGNRRDGFDVNAISVQGIDEQDIPEPTSILSLLFVGALGAQTLRKRQAA
ncbi:MAG: PEP-CTERM sorting domain-containing protein [Cyanobacteria bacterium P01_A01_bin.116]